MDNAASPYLRRFIILYGLANIGVVISFLPLLILILPVKAAYIDADNKLLLLSIALCTGAIMAAISNIISGWISDWQVRKYGNRFGQIAFGLLCILLAYIVFWSADSWAGLIAAILFFQLSLNIIYAPMGALLADYIPDHSKGRTAALLNLGIAAASLTIAILTLTIFNSELSRLLALAVIILTSVAPLLWHAAKGHIPPMLAHRHAGQALTTNKAGEGDSAYNGSHDGAYDEGELNRADLIWAWIGRFFIQFSSALLLGYVFYYLQDIVLYAQRFPDRSVDQGVGTLNILAIPFAVIGGLAAGYWSDKLGLRRPFLSVMAFAIALALGILIIAPAWPIIIAAYILFSAALSVFQAIDAALITQLLSRTSKKGRIMGYMNLGYTLPAIMAPALAIILSSEALPADILRIMLVVAACLAMLAIISVMQISSVR